MNGSIRIVYRAPPQSKQDSFLLRVIGQLELRLLSRSRAQTSIRERWLSNSQENECEIDKGKAEREREFSSEFPRFCFSVSPLCAFGPTVVRLVSAVCYLRCTFSTKINAVQFFAGFQWVKSCRGNRLAGNELLKWKLFRWLKNKESSAIK